MSDLSRNTTIRRLIEEAGDGIPIYLHKELHTGNSEKASMLKANSVLSLKVLQTLEKTHGGSCPITVGYKPLEILADVKTASGRSKILPEITSLVQADAKLPVPQHFINYSSLIMAAKNLVSLFSSPPANPIEKLIIDFSSELSAKRDKNIFGSMLLRAISDALAVLYLDEIDVNKKTLADNHEAEEKRSARVAGVMLKDVAYCRELELGAGVDLEQSHAKISAHLILGRGDKITQSDLDNVENGLKNKGTQVAEVVRVVLEHENIYTKSRLAKGVIRGIIFSKWLLDQRNANQPVLERKVLQKIGYFDPPEIRHFLDLAVLCMSPECEQIIRQYVKKKMTIRINMFEHFLEGKGAHLPLPDAVLVDKCFNAAFMSLPDFNRTGFQVLRHLIQYKNELLLHGHTLENAGRDVAILDKRIKNVLF